MTAETNAETGGRGFRAVELCNPHGISPIVLICEHASNHIPDGFGALGLAEQTRFSHIAWDPGAMPVSRHLSAIFDARLVASRVSRLLYDCNRPPDSPDAIPARRERFDIPGNAHLSATQTGERVSSFYDPFRDLLADTISSAPAARVIVTIHSFTPVFMGQRRDVEIGIVHDTDSRLADEMLKRAKDHTSMRILRNEPYGPEDGVTHTLKLHAIENGLVNVMLEIRNDLIAAEQQQRDVAEMLAGWIKASLRGLGVDVTCEVPACRV